MPLEGKDRIGRRIVRMKLGPRHRLREHSLFQQPALIGGSRL
jgi:hypothetical protein